MLTEDICSELTATSYLSNAKYDFSAKASILSDKSSHNSWCAAGYATEGEHLDIILKKPYLFEAVIIDKRTPTDAWASKLLLKFYKLDQFVEN